MSKIRKCDVNVKESVAEVLTRLHGKEEIWYECRFMHSLDQRRARLSYVNSRAILFTRSQREYR